MLGLKEDSAAFMSANSVRKAHDCHPCKVGNFVRTMEHKGLMMLMQQIAQAEREGDQEKKRSLKEKLPVVVMGASGLTGDGRRCEENVVPSGKYCLDIDHLSADGDAEDLYNTYVRGRETKNGIFWAFVSPSGRGLKLAYNMLPGESLEDSQLRIASLLPDWARTEPYLDIHKDLSRCTYMVSADRFLYLDLAMMFSPNESLSAPVVKIQEVHLTNDGQLSNGDSDYVWDEMLEDMLANNELPEALQLTLRDVRKGARFPVLCSTLAIASAYADRVSFDWLGKTEYLQLYSICVGEGSSGKGQYVGSSSELWRKPLEDADEPIREAAVAFKKLSKSQQDKQPRPTGVERIVGTNVTAADLANQLENAEGRCLLWWTDELSDVAESRQNSQQISSYLLKAWHREKIDKRTFSREGADCYCPHPAIALSATTTMVGLRAFLPVKKLEDGLITRIMFSFMDSNRFQRGQRITPFSKEEKQLIFDTVKSLGEREDEIGRLPFEEDIHRLTGEWIVRDEDNNDNLRDTEPRSWQPGPPYLSDSCSTTSSRPSAPSSSE